MRRHASALEVLVGLVMLVLIFVVGTVLGGLVLHLGWELTRFGWRLVG